MKKLLFAVLFIVGNSINSNAQIWKFTSGGNDFDGRYKTSSIKGSASNYPYNKPRLVINYFDKDNSLNFYIINAGYYSDSSDVKVLWVFNNEKDIIYETPLINLSSDGKSIFFEEFKSPKSGEYLSVYEFIDKLKKATNVSVRVKGQFDKNDIKFSLRGSTKAINYVISKEEFKSKIDEIKNQRREQYEKNEAIAVLENKKKFLFESLIKTIKNEKLNETSLSILKSKIKNDLGIGYFGKKGIALNYKVIKIKPTTDEVMFKQFGYVDLFYLLEDDTEKKIKGIYQVEMNAPIFNMQKTEE